MDRISVCNVIKNWWSMAYTVCSAPIPIRHRSVAKATRESPTAMFSTLAVLHLDGVTLKPV